MKAIIFSILLCTFFSAKCQYYYSDIIGSKELSKQQAAYIKNNVKTLTASGTDKNGVKASDFSEYHEVKENGAGLRIVNISGFTKTTSSYKFDNTGSVISVFDSTSAVQNLSTYFYDEAGRLSKIQNKVTDSSGNFNQTEVHTWIYNANGKPEKMWRTFDGQNSRDSMEVKFTIDENGNVGEEKAFKRGKETSFLYYYYDDKNQLTDIVRFNTKLKKLLPDIMFEYDDARNIIQKITTTSSQRMGYLIWRYIFNDKGLKTKEALFNSQKQLTGKIEYNYTFSK